MEYLGRYLRYLLGGLPWAAALTVVTVAVLAALILTGQT